MISHYITKLTNVGGRHKTARNKVTLKDINNPFSILSVSFLATNRFDILRVSKNNIAELFKDIIYIRIMTYIFPKHITTLL